MGRLAAALSAPGLGAVAEIKRRSPSAGDLRPGADPAALAAAYERAGASAVSVLVDERFAGSWDDLRAARAASTVPLLAKGFFTSPDDLGTAREAGADAALLILRDLDDETYAALMRRAEELGLDVLVEAHDLDELERAVNLNAPVIGVNARDLATFDIDRQAQLRLVAQAPRDRVVVAESGIWTRGHGAAAELAGADAILVGSALMRAPDPAAKLAELISRPLVKVCGLTREEDVAAAADAGADSSLELASTAHGLTRSIAARTLSGASRPASTTRPSVLAARSQCAGSSSSQGRSRCVATTSPSRSSTASRPRTLPASRG